MSVLLAGALATLEWFGLAWILRRRFRKDDDLSLAILLQGMILFFLTLFLFPLPLFSVFSISVTVEIFSGFSFFNLVAFACIFMERRRNGTKRG